MYMYLQQSRPLYFSFSQENSSKTLLIKVFMTYHYDTDKNIQVFHSINYFQEINMGQRASDTRGITFEDVLVPKEVSDSL